MKRSTESGNKNCREITSALEPRNQHDSEIKQTEQAKE